MASPRRPLVLVVDDDRAQAMRIAEWAMSHGYMAVAAPCCVEARAAMLALPVCALVSQVALRDGSLFGLVRSVGSRRPRVVVGYCDLELSPESSPEIDACLVAPVDVSSLAPLLDARLRSPVTSDTFHTAAPATPRPTRRTPIE